MKLILILIIAIILTSCKPEVGTRSSIIPKNNILDNTIVKGNAMLGPIEDAEVVAYSILSNGTLDLLTPLASTKTDINGNYSLIIPNNILSNNPLGIQISGGRYIEEASGNIIQLENKSLTALIPKIVKSSQVFATVGPLSDMAFQIFQSKILNKKFESESIAQIALQSNQQISQAFGLSDIVGIIPSHPNGLIANNASGQYTIILAAISHAAQSEGTDSLSLANTYAKQFNQDGTFSEVGKNAISTTDVNGKIISITPPALSNLLKITNQIGNGDLLIKGLKPPTRFTSPVFDNLPLSPSNSDDSSVKTCSTFTYSPFGPCQSNNLQLRNILSSLPVGCTGGNSQTTQACQYVSPVVTCSSFTYSAFWPCQPNNQQTRSIVSSLPLGCTGGSPQTMRACQYVPPSVACSSFTYGAYGACQPNNQKSRNILSSLPAGCSGGIPQTTQACQYVPPFVTCTSFSYGAFGACQSNNQQSRSVLSSLPTGCSGGNPQTTQSCQYVPPVVTCSSFTYGAFGACQSNNQQSRSVLSSLPTGCSGGNPQTTQSCQYVPPVVTCSSFTYGAYGICQSNNQQTRSVLSSLPTGCSGGNPKTTQTCQYIPPVVTCSSFTYSAYGACQTNNLQSRSVLSRTPYGCTGGTPITSQACQYVPPVIAPSGCYISLSLAGNTMTTTESKTLSVVCTSGTSLTYSWKKGNSSISSSPSFIVSGLSSGTHTYTATVSNSLGNQTLTQQLIVSESSNPIDINIPSVNISANIFGSPLVITATKRFAGAISSLTWKGVEFIDSYDHGRELQSASSFDGLGECFNPTEAGSDEYPGSPGVNPGDGTGNTSTSKLLSISATANVLKTTNQMAFWTPAGQPYPSGCGNHPNIKMAQNTTDLSNHLLSKQVTIGFAGIPNVIEYLTNYYVSEAHNSAVFEALTGYMPSKFSKFWTYNPITGNLNSLSHEMGEQPIPIIFSTQDEQYAMGIYSPDLPQSNFPTAGYGRFDFSSQGTTKWNAVFRTGNTPIGNYSFRTYTIVGSLSQVKQAMQSTYAHFNPNSVVDHTPLGNIDNVSSTAISGWACAKNSDKSIFIHLYAGGVAGVGTFVGGFSANNASETAVATECNSTGKTYRFSIPVSAAMNAQYANKTIYVYGLNPFTTGAANSLLNNSGTFKFASSENPPKNECSPKEYYKQRPDVALARIEALTHYNSNGKSEGACNPILPQCTISTSAYNSQRPDVVQAGMTAANHYRLYGQFEGMCKPI
jgi:hypothetical protein